MNENHRKFFSTKYSEIPRTRIWFYSFLAASCFGIVGLITGQTKINIVGGCAAIIFIHLLGKWCECELRCKAVKQITSGTNRPAFRCYANKEKIMIQKRKITRGQFVASLATLVLLSLIVIGWSGFMQSGEIVFMIVVVTVFAGILPFFLGVTTQAIFRRKMIPSYAAWALAFILIAIQWLYTRKTAIRVLEQNIVSIAFSFIIVGAFINAGMKSCRAFYEGNKSKTQD